MILLSALDADLRRFKGEYGKIELFNKKRIKTVRHRREICHVLNDFFCENSAS